MKNYYTESTWAVYSLTRFCLSIIVLIVHLQWFADTTLWSTLIISLGPKTAVISFLLISGVSVGYSFKKQAKGYFERRFLRIYPLYFFGVLFAALLMFLLPSPYPLPHLDMAASGWKTAAANFIFGQGFFAIAIPYNIPLWSLSIEVFFYILLPWLTRLRTEIIVAFTVLSLFIFVFTKESSTLYGYVAVRYAWPWLIGFIISVKEKRGLGLMLASTGVIAILCSESTPESLSWLTYTSTSALVLYGYKLRISHRLKKVFNYLGEISYPLYILHVPLAIIFFLLIDQQPMWVVITLLLCTIPLLNYILDYWLKQLFWQPLVNTIKKKVTPIFGQLSITRFI